MTAQTEFLFAYDIARTDSSTAKMHSTLWHDKIISADKRLLHIAAQCWIGHETLKTRKYNTQCHCMPAVL